MEPQELQPVTWLKAKYSCYKQKGRYKGGGGTGAPKKTKGRKIGGGPNPVETVKVITAGGHVRWDTRPREKR